MEAVPFGCDVRVWSLGVFECPEVVSTWLSAEASRLGWRWSLRPTGVINWLFCTLDTAGDGTAAGIGVLGAFLRSSAPGAFFFGAVCDAGTSGCLFLEGGSGTGSSGLLLFADGSELSAGSAVGSALGRFSATGLFSSAFLNAGPIFCATPFPDRRA